MAYNKEQYREYMRKYRAEHPEYCKRNAKKSRERLLADPEKLEARRAYMREYNKKPEIKEKRKAYFKKRYHTDPEFRAKQIAATVDYQRRNPEKVREALERWWRKKLGVEE